MFGFRVRVENAFHRVQAEARKGAARSIGHAAAIVRKIARLAIEKDPDPAPPGFPPHTRRGQLPRAILFHADETSAVVGPSATLMGTSGKAHEFGGRYKKEIFEERPFMFPALKASTGRFAGQFAGSIGE